MQPFILFDSADRNQGRLYTDFISVESFTADTADNLDAALVQGQQRGQHACLLLPYDFGRDIVGIARTQAVMSLYWFGQCRAVENVAQWLERLCPDTEPAGVIAPQFLHDKAAFSRAIADIHRRIRAGETYQVNFTTRCDFQYYGQPPSLYRQLRRVQPAPYAVLGYFGQAHWLLSLSPERFFSLRQRRITAEPMKGTAPITGDGQDETRRQQLAADSKNRAENTMIVDLLRNDLGKVAMPGSVVVRRPFAVKAHGRVWQMTTEVEAVLPPDYRYSTLIRALFPCGSVTGAPKYRTMQYIDALEAAPRGLYTGSIGYIDADGSACFNILIRSLELNGQQGMMGVGSGITIDSTAAGEYEECRWKAAFLQHSPAIYTLFETMALHNGTIAAAERHLQRLRRSAAALGFRCNTAAIREALAQCVRAQATEDYRLKLSLAFSGEYRLQVSPCPLLPGENSAVLYPQLLPVAQPLRRFKTSARAVYDAAVDYATAHGAFDALLFNEDGFLLEGGRTNVFVFLEDGWHTPALTLDILPGIMRQMILERPQDYLHTDRIRESRIHKTQLLQAKKICLSNALRGIIPVTLPPL